MYEPIKNFYAGEKDQFKDGFIPLHVRIAAAITTGAIGISIANPTDVVKVRFQADGRKKQGERRYENLRHAYAKILREEG